MSIIREIEDFCARTGMAESRLTMDALGNPSFPRNVRNGSNPRPETLAKLRAFMSRYEADAERTARRFILDVPEPPNDTVALREPARKPRIPAAVLKARAIDGRDLFEFIEALVLMGLDCWRDDRIAHGEPTEAAPPTIRPH